MEQIKEIVNTLAEIQENRIFDIIIVVVIIILSIMMSSVFAFLTMKIFKLKENHIKIKKHPLS